MSSSPLPKVARRGLAQESADLIREAIHSGGFAPGSSLLEVELAASLGVSRGSVREGMALLEREGLIRSDSPTAAATVATATARACWRWT